MSPLRSIARPAAAILLAIWPAVIACSDGQPARRVKKLPANPPPPPPTALAASTTRAPLPGVSGAELVAQLGCAGCHPGLGGANDRRAASPSLAGIRARHPAGYIFAYLADPSRARSGDGRARMPDFHLDERERLALTLYLDAIGGDGGGRVTLTGSEASDGSRKLDAAFERARKSNPGITAAMGGRIFASLNCAACHSQPGVTPWLSGPDLSAEGSRVKPGWLRDFLAKPHAVRPFGAYAGSGSRMPDFHLSAVEVDSLAAYLGTKQAALAPVDRQQRLSVFARREVESLLRNRLSCLGCHQLDGEGGRIGPELSSAGSRLRPAYIRAIITDPRHSAPGTIMPLTPMPEREAARIVEYLAGRDSSAPRSADSADVERAGYLSLVDNAPSTPVAGDGAEALYGRICANCHGATGGGDGWNAVYLPVRPTRHSDAKYMSTRTDGTIYDGIAAGGYVLDRSNRMPAFGETLSRVEIGSLVKYIRKLCGCAGPAWSRDGAAP